MQYHASVLRQLEDVFLNSRAMQFQSSKIGKKKEGKLFEAGLGQSLLALGEAHRTLLVSTVGVATDVDVALLNRAVGAGSAGGDCLPDDAAVVADAELGRTVADDHAILGAAVGTRFTG